MIPSNRSSVKPVQINDYLFMLLQHKLLILICFIFGLLIAFLIFNSTPPGYETKAKLTIKPNFASALLTGEKGGMDSAFFQELSLNTHMELICSRPVIEKLIDQLHLDKNRINSEGWLHQFLSQIKENLYLLTGTAKSLSPAELRNQLIQSLKSKIELNKINYTNILEIIARDSDPQVANDIANTLAEIYIQYDINNNQQASSSSSSFLKKQAVEFKEKLESAEAEFINFKKQENILSFDGKKYNIEGKITEYDSLLRDAKNKQQQLALRLNELGSLAEDKKNYAVRLRSLVGNPVIDNLNNQLIAAEIEQSKLSKIYRSKHIEMQSIQSTIDNLRQEITRQIDKEIINMKQEKGLLQASEEKIQNSIEELKKEAMLLGEKEQQYKLLERNVETYRQYYDSLAAKIEDASVGSEIRNAVTNISFVERAQVPLHPVKPDKKKIFLAGVFGGLFSGIGLALLLEFSDRTIRTEEDVQACCDLAVLGIIPVAGGKAAYRSKYMPSEEGWRA